MPEPGPLQLQLRPSLWLEVAEFALVAGLFSADVHCHIYLSQTPYLFLLGWAFLRLRGLRWKGVGFARPRNWMRPPRSGATGMIENIWNGLVLGSLYLACGRNLALPVMAHAATDRLDLVLIYLGKYPGMR